MTKSKYPPILFNTEMVQAILDNRKKQTRRIQGLEIINKNPDDYILDGLQIIDFYIFHNKFSRDEIFIKPKYNIGDVLWVRETWHKIFDAETDKFLKYGYKADHSTGIWSPSIHMPKASARIFLKITRVRVERLRDISELDAVDEGFGKVVTKKYEHPGWYINHLNKHHMFNAVDSFASMWVKLNGNGAWKQNPYVWVYDFDQVEKPADFLS